ncbi:MAG: ribonuclease R [Candidatus Glassbacteria bacterium]|nr:ribonuclease R [Candidatus Glassbacteria bacterium]
MGISKKALRKYFEQAEHGSPVKAKQIASDLGVKHKDYPVLKQVLQELADEGLLNRVKKNAFALPGGGETVSGRMQIVRRGFGFLIPDSGGDDVFVPGHSLGGAFDGDKVEVEVTGRSRGDKPEGEVRRITGRARRRFVGELQKRSKFSRLLPNEESITTEILIPAEETSRLKNGQKVMVEIFDWGDGSCKPLGKVLRVLDRPDSPPDEEIILKYEFPEKFPAVLLREAARLAVEPSEQLFEGRSDYRHLDTFTIDPVDAADFDDALSWRPLPEGGAEVGVHIADVSHYVLPGSSLDEEARERATSIYLHEAYVPMLPEDLSSGVCSLVEGKDRFVMSVMIRLDSRGRIVGHRLTPSVIRSDKRLDYEQAQQIIEMEAGAGNFSETTVRAVKSLADLSKKRIELRADSGRMDFDLPEPLVLRSAAGKPVEIIRKPRLDSHRLVEEFMITANELVAGRLTERKLPTLYRIHEPPDPEGVDNVNFKLRTIDRSLEIPADADKLSPAAYSAVIERAEELGLGELASLIVVQSMKRALYSVENRGHFGLASESYTHFTSPIRRYPDLVIHRLLKYLIAEEREGTQHPEDLLSVSSLAEIAVHCSSREQMIESAERESDDRVEARFMQRHEGEKFDALITAVKSNGFRVRLKNVYVEGYVYAGRMEDDFYELSSEEAALVGKKSGRIFRLGQTLEVVLVESDPERRRIDFLPAVLLENGARPKASQNRRGRRNRRSEKK